MVVVIIILSARSASPIPSQVVRLASLVLVGSTLDKRLLSAEMGIVERKLVWDDNIWTTANPDDGVICRVVAHKLEARIPFPE